MFYPAPALAGCPPYAFQDAGREDRAGLLKATNLTFSISFLRVKRGLFYGS